MSNYPLSKYSAKIKDVYIELKNYQFFHSPYNESATKNRFIGRQKVKNRIISILSHTNVKSGSYLITGFRGMGKTSVVREALQDFNNRLSDDNGNDIRYLLASLISGFLKMLRIFLCCIVVYFLFFSSRLPDDGSRNLFIIESYLAFVIALLIGFVFKKRNRKIISRLFARSRKNVSDKRNFFDRSNFHKLKSFLFVILIFLFLAIISLPPAYIFFNYKNWTDLNIDAVSYVKLLPDVELQIWFVFLIIALITTFLSEFFEAVWSYFRIIFVVFLFVLSGLFFLDYEFVCDNQCPSQVTNVMSRYFPPVSFQKKAVPASPEGKETNLRKFRELWIKMIGLPTSPEVKETNSKPEVDVVTIVFRITVSILAAYILLSSIVFLVDLFYLIRVRFRYKNIEESRKYHPVEINLSQDSLSEIEILRRMTIAIELYWEEHRFDFGDNLFNRKLYFPWRFIIQKIDRPRKNQYRTSYKSISGKLNLLKNRMSGQMTTRRERSTPPNITTPIANIAEISMPIGTYSDNDEIVFPAASVKEAEDQLKEILNDIDKLRNFDNKFLIPQFVFIIDELDKIDPHNNNVVQERELSNPGLDNSAYADDTNRFRQRREAVGRLLANLKGFLNVAKAKFFFIGGREMFDADLADIADRESFYSSIFNDVIYVESFFRDSIERENKSAGGVTQMTETYICNIILNDLTGAAAQNNYDKDRFEANHLTLKNLHSLINIDGRNLIFEFGTKESAINKSIFKVVARSRENLVKNLVSRYIYFVRNLKPRFLRAYFKRNSKIFRFLNSLRVKLTGLSPDKASISEDEANRQKYKVISTLQNYIVYLTYRSSGTPKKLTSLTEQLIVKGPKFDKDSREDKNTQFFEENVVVLHNPVKENEDLSDRLFLKFGFNTQYELGLTSNLYRPYLITNSRHLKALGDKLLFSSSFIIDHILKFHPFGFSWRNLELIPEVVLINREPNLREFIEELMRFYSLNYIRDTVSGIFDYRFRSIIRRELIHLSKTSDLSAAAFNFTLDESFATKRHYKRKIMELRDKYKDYQTIEGDNRFVHSLYFLQTIVGDLHFYDKEYDEAILYYTESIQTLRLPNAITDRKITRHQFLLWVKNKLKLALSLEKIRAFDSAFSIYKTLILDSDRYFKNIVSKEDNDSERRDRRRRVSKISDHNVNEAEDHRSIHLICMPFVALLAVTEKLRNDGITYTNLFTNRRDFLKTINVSNADLETNTEKEKVFDKYRKCYLLADYYNNVGSILYYKNCQFSEFFKNESFWLDAFVHNKGEGDKIIDQQVAVYKGSSKGKPYDFFPSLAAFNYYWNSLYYLLKYHQTRLSEKVTEKLPRYANDDDPERIPLKDNLLALCTTYLLPECIDMVSSNRLYYVANVISKIGDCILASLNEDTFVIPEKPFNALDITNWSKNTDKKTTDSIEWFIENGRDLFTAETVLYIYKLAAALYKRAGYNSYYSSHLTRILYVIKDLIQSNKSQKKEIKDFLELGRNKDKPFEKLEEIAETVFRATTWNNEVSNRPQILKYREVFNISIKGNKDRELIYNIINNISDSKEVIVLVESIKIKLNHLINKKSFIEDHFTLGKIITSAYGTMSNRYQRMLELKYRTERCFYIVNDVLNLGALFDKDLKFTKKHNRKKFTKADTGEAFNYVINQINEIIKAEDQEDINITINDVVAFLIHEALFCLSQLIRKIKLYNPGYVIGFSFIAEAHSRMGAWCQAYDNYLKIIDEDIYENQLMRLQSEQDSNPSEEGKNKLDEWKENEAKIKRLRLTKSDFGKNRKELYEEYSRKLNKLFKADLDFDTYTVLNDWIEKASKIATLKKDTSATLKRKFNERVNDLLGGEGLIYLESKNHYESAVQYYYKMIQLHSDGKTYKDKLHEIYMLEDDYNDNMAHYTIAAERVRINTGKIKEKIIDLNNQIKDSKVYKYDSYLISNKEILDNTDPEIILKYLNYFGTSLKQKK